MYLPYEQNDFDAVETIYGFTNEEATIQELGSIATREGRLLTFPNVMQHRVEPFELEDKTQPGYRKLIALFLVDPHVRIISTAEVPPQQKNWWKDVVRTMASGEEGDRGLGLLPVELREKILDATDGFPISLEWTKYQREHLMGERTAFVEWQGTEFRDKGQFNVSLPHVSHVYEQADLVMCERPRYHFEADAAWNSYANIKTSQNTKSVISRRPFVGLRTERPRATNTWHIAARYRHPHPTDQNWHHQPKGSMTYLPIVLATR